MGFGPCGVVSFTFHVHASQLRFTSRDLSPCVCTFIVVSVNVAVCPSSNSFSMDISSPDLRWGKVCAIFSLVDSKGLMLSSALWVA